MAFTKILGPGIATDANLQVGILSATKFYGDGSNLVGVGVTRSITIGTRSGSYIQNAVGTGITIPLRSGTIGTASF